MQSRDFCYWLQGFFELSGTKTPLTKEQCKTIKNHLAMVFAHEIDPSFGTPEERTALQDLHDEEGVKDGDRAKRAEEELREYFGTPRPSCSHDIKLMC